MAKSQQASRETLLLLLAVLLITVLGVAFLMSRPWDTLRAVAFYFAGRTGACTLAEAVQSIGVTTRQVSGTRRAILVSNAPGTILVPHGRAQAP